MRSLNTGTFLARRFLATVFACLLSSLAMGATLKDAQTLLAQGKADKALQETDKLLATAPRDRSLQLFRGVVLTELNRLDEAAGIFIALSREAPEQPQPYNNLAVVYARQQQYDKAWSALDMALRTSTVYGTTYKNLGDVYAQMARQAYDKALQNSGAPRATAPKLSLIYDMSVTGNARPAPTAALATASSSSTASSALMVASSSSAAASRSEAAKASSSATSTMSTTALSSARSAASISQAVAASSIPKVATASSSSRSASSASSRDAFPNAGEADVIRAVQNWADAWSRKDVRDYLAAYAQDFNVPGGASRAVWERERRNRIDKPGNIKVSVSNIQVSIKNDIATARFRQVYNSSNFDAASSKTLVMTRQGNRWLIQQERVGR
jgi:ketosteroid isomerase-like protein